MKDVARWGVIVEVSGNRFVRRAGRKVTSMKTQRMTIPIEGLSCGGGGSLQVERALSRLSGVVYAYVNPATEMAYVEYDPEQVDNERLVKVAERAGFRAGVPNLR